MTSFLESFLRNILNSKILLLVEWASKCILTVIMDMRESLDNLNPLAAKHDYSRFLFCFIS